MPCFQLFLNFSHNCSPGHNTNGLPNQKYLCLVGVSGFGCDRDLWILHFSFYGRKTEHYLQKGKNNPFGAFVNAMLLVWQQDAEASSCGDQTVVILCSLVHFSSPRVVKVLFSAFSEITLLLLRSLKSFSPSLSVVSCFHRTDGDAASPATHVAPIHASS